MRRFAQFAGRLVWVLVLWTFAGPGAAFAQTPVDTSRPIIVKQKPHKTQYSEFKGTVMHANVAQITVRGMDNELAVRTFPLSKVLSEKMQKIIERGGYQYGDKVKILYDPATEQAVKIKGKPSRPL